MTQTTIHGGVVHLVPQDLRVVLQSNTTLVSLWNSLTPLSRNEWICWITIVKKDTTRKEHIERLCTDLQKGKRRPCCWAGCPHRKQKIEK